jgi:glycosyltransferase involved in cell wall biosynthesis
MSGVRSVLLVLHRAARAGTEFHALWLAQGLRARGWEVSLCVSEGGALLDSFRAVGVSMHRIPRRLGFDPVYVARLAGLARRLRPDVLHAHSGRLAILAGRLAGVPACIETRHGLGAGELALTARALRREARRCRRSHLTLTVSGVDQDRLVSAGLAPSRVRWIPNGIPPGGLRCAPARSETVRLGFLGRLTEQKDPLFLIPLAQELDRRMPGRWSLAVAGDGPLRSELERGLRAPAARLLGEIDGPTSLLGEIDFLCLPSLWEGQPLGVLEAMAAGVIVVARAIPTLAELLGGIPPAGLLLPPDPSVWGAEIASLATDAARRARMIDEASARVRAGHDLGRMVERIEAAYLETLAAGGRR